jgi:galactokinase
MSGSSENLLQLFVPGRLCLFGEHSDWAAEMGVHKGFCLVTGTDQGLRATVAPSGRFIVSTLVPGDGSRGHSSSGRSRQMECPYDHHNLLAAAQDPFEFFRYCAGVACQFLGRSGVEGGMEIRITAMDLPLQKGVSSSAAVCILVAEAFNQVYRLGMFPHELMEVAYQGERLTGSECGRMDQACIYGKMPVLLTFEKDRDVRVEPVLPGGEFYMFLVDLAGHKDTIRILSDLRAGYGPSERLQLALGQDNERIVRQAYSALKTGSAEQLGELMSQSQRVFDESVAPHSQAELASPLLHQVLSMKGIAGLVYGGKGVGSQGDGTAQFIARSESDRRQAMREITQAFPQMRCFPLTIAPGLEQVGLAGRQ